MFFGGSPPVDRDWEGSGAGISSFGSSTVPAPGVFVDGEAAAGLGACNFAIRSAIEEAFGEEFDTTRETDVIRTSIFRLASAVFFFDQFRSNRNPTGKDRAWCYTTNPEIEWQYCAVPYCEE